MQKPIVKQPGENIEFTITCFRPAGVSTVELLDYLRTQLREMVKLTPVAEAVYADTNVKQSAVYLKPHQVTIIKVTKKDKT